MFAAQTAALAARAKGFLFAMIATQPTTLAARADGSFYLRSALLSSKIWSLHGGTHG